MKSLLLGAALNCTCVASAVAEEPLAVGTMIKLRAENVYFGCSDVENAKEIERIRAEANASSSAYRKGVQAVARACAGAKGCVRFEGAGTNSPGGPSIRGHEPDFSRRLSQLTRAN